MLKDYFEQLGAECIVYRNNEVTIEFIQNLTFDAIVISPGPKTPNEAGILLELISAYYNKLPILGICLGHQAIAQFFGASLFKANIPRHGKVDSMLHNDDVMFDKIPNQFFATRYHSLIINNLPDELIPTCYSNHELMAFKHNQLPIWGIQFHPESCKTEHGLQMIKNFTEMAKSHHYMVNSN
jgi:anthranilate synthase/aminodeoxychorismate synthase-like glutamine amidotransferase